MKRAINRIFGLIRKMALDEEGSAVLEFVALALPLFIPLFIFLNQYAVSSDAQSSLRTLSREMARGFVTSENDQVAERVTFEIFSKGAAVLGMEEELANGTLTYFYQCKSQPCISPNNEIVITVRSRAADASISTVEYVSAWS
jgi:Flp pilus assembly protein TadG